jgi:serine/threonine protein phosphatase PrpC
MPNVLTTTVAALHDNSVHGEDAYLVRPLGRCAGLDAVMDGVTRRKGGEASRYLAGALAAAPLRSADDVAAVLEEVNRHLYELGWGRFWLTTAATALYRDGALYVASVGDSPITLVRPDSCRPLCGGMRSARIGDSGQLTHLYRAEVALDPGDRVLLATDGVTDRIANHELFEILRRAASPDDAAGQIRALMAAQQAGERPAASSGGRIRGDDWTAIVRFFAAPD